MKKLSQLILIILCSGWGLLSSSTAVAQDSPDGSGFYMGLNLGYANRHLNQNSFFQAASSTTTKGFVGRASGGYSFGPYFAFEAGFTLLPKAKAEFPTYEVESARSYFIDFLFRASVPFKEHFSPYAKLGIAYVNTVLNYTDQIQSQAKEYRPVCVGFGLCCEPQH